MAMKKGDTAFIYHSVGPKEIVGIAVVTGEHHPDPKDDTGKWVAVDIAPVEKLARPITLAEVKAHPVLSKMELVRQSRLSVAPVTAAEDKLLRKLASKPA
jgi:predicted RNA-binding protein with PUA-like domain